MKIAVYFDSWSPRSCRIADAMRAGALAKGLDIGTVTPWTAFNGAPVADVAVAYGWGHPEVFAAYTKAGAHYVYLDLGWWKRKPPGEALGGYHKVCLDGRDPPLTHWRNMPHDRAAALGIEIKPWRGPRDDMAPILIAGMSAKSAKTRGMGPEQWERGQVGVLSSITRRPLRYRPKPSWDEARPIHGAGFSAPWVDLEEELGAAWAVVTHASNVAVDALVAGVPIYVEHGPATEFTTRTLLDIERPAMPDGREQFIADLAYAQWSVAEMESGAVWDHLLSRGPLCRS